jgi:digeranylgeranylglycerophospholipid reductase
MECDFLVVGGGPVGSTFAALAAKAGSTVVVEEHEQVGVPVQCTGLVSPRVVELAGAEAAVLNALKGARFHFPDGRILSIVSDVTKALVVDRRAFDIICVDRAASHAEYLRGERFVTFRRNNSGIEVDLDNKDGKRTVSAQLVVGADGYKSQVGQIAALGKCKEFVRGIQVDIDHQMQHQEVIDVFLGNKVAPGFFAWQIPCRSFTRVGLCVGEGYGAPNEYLAPLLKSIGLADAKRLAVVSGIIPIGPPARTYADNVIIVGDAAAQAKPLSGGGLFPGLVAARCAAETAIEAKAEQDFSARKLRAYQDRWKEEVGKELDRGGLIRKAFVTMSDRQLDDAGRLMDQPHMVEILATGDIDFPGVLAPQVLKAAPGLIRFAPHFLGSLMSR